MAPAPTTRIRMGLSLLLVLFRRLGESQDPLPRLPLVGQVGAPAHRQTRSGGYGSPEFTNEVQHFHLEVLPWGGLTNSSPLTIDARLPAFRPMAARSGESRQLWIGRHQRSLGS